ncbi:MAG: hypothetical protein ACLTXM_02140 [Enterococcus sp.]
MNHEFKLINKDSDLENIFELKSFAVLSDETFQYIGDSFEWFYGMWNNDYKEKGLNYYGWTVLDDGDIVQFKNIIESWATLFKYSPPEFELKIGYDLDKNDFEKFNFSRKNLIQELKSIVNLCDTAITKQIKIVHLGI